MKDNTRPPSSEKLKGADDAYRIRVGDHRILCEVIDQDLVISIIEAEHRREVYR